MKNYSEKCQLHKQSFLIDADMSKDELLAQLAELFPGGQGRHEIYFSNGAKVSDLGKAQPWSDTPLNKILIAEQHLGEIGVKGGRALDIGCNIGYNSIYLASQKGMNVTGIDVTDWQMNFGRFISQLADLETVSFKKEDAEIYLEQEEFDLVVHFGTLYHLRNPVLALETAAKNLKPGGVLLLETQCHGKPGDGSELTRYVNGFNNDISNWWALGDGCIRKILEFNGFSEVSLLWDWTSPLLDGMYRGIYSAKKVTDSKIRYDDMDHYVPT